MIKKAMMRTYTIKPWIKEIKFYFSFDYKYNCNYNETIKALIHSRKDEQKTYLMVINFEVHGKIIHHIMQEEGFKEIKIGRTSVYNDAVNVILFRKDEERFVVFDMNLPETDFALRGLDVDEENITLRIMSLFPKRKGFFYTLFENVLCLKLAASYWVGRKK